MLILLRKFSRECFGGMGVLTRGGCRHSMVSDCDGDEGMGRC